jgi:cell wall-associated NlpC family hydrolase
MALIVLAGSGVLPLGSSAISTAAPIDDKRAQAKAIQAQIDDLDIKISALAEQLHSAEEARDAALAAAKEAETQIVAARQEVSRTRKIVRARWAAIYQQSISGQGINELNLSNTDQLLSSRQYAKNQASSDNEMLDQLAVAQQDLAVKKSDYTAAAKEAEAQSLTIGNSKRELEAAEAQQTAVLAQVSADIDALIKEEQRRQAAAAAAAASAGRGRSSGRSPETFPDLPPPGPAAANAIAWARAQIGKPYNNTNPTRFGPDAFDCSGLIYMAYGMAGVSIPKVSGPQYRALPHVSMDALLPGDLIFWGGGGGSHVALYVGGGQVVDAGRSNGVSERAIWGSPEGAARPTG